MANETKIIITAATAQAEAAMAKLGGTVGGLSKKMFDLSGVMGALGGALSITAFAGIIKQSIDAADRLDELSQITGTSVEALAGLDYAAKQNGASLETVARGGQKLSAILSDKPELFKKLGISATDSTEAMIQLADIFAGMPDGIDKSALAAKLFGDRLGGEMILFLNQGTAAMRANIAAGREYNPVTAESARQAAEFNDNLDKLKASAGGAGMAMTNDLLPQLTQISEAMALAAREGGLLQAVWVGLGGLGTAVFTDDMLERTAQIEKRINSINAEIQSAEGMRGIATPISVPLRIERGNLEQELEDIRRRAENTAKQVKPPEKPADSGKGKSLLGALGGDGKAKKEKPFDPEGDFWFAVDEAAMKNQQKRNEEYLKDLAKAEEETNKKLQSSALEAQAIIFDIDPIAKVSAEWEKLTALKEQGLLTDEQIGKSYAKTFENIGKDGSDAFKSLENAVRGWGDEFTDQMTQVVRTGKLNFSSLADSIINDLIRIQIQKNITEPLLKAGTGFMGDLFGGGGDYSSVAPGALANANGNVFSGPGISAYSGSVVDKPTLFPFARGTGLMGEAGAEAILPLTRINGKLGVQAQGGGNAAPNVVINLSNQSGQNVNAKQQGGPQFNGSDWVIGVVLEAADSNPHFRNAMGMSR